MACSQVYLPVSSLDLKICPTLSDFYTWPKVTVGPFKEKAVVFSAGFWVYREREVQHPFEIQLL